MGLAEVVLPFLNDTFLRVAGPHRDALLEGARGRVLELGFGSGLNAACYGAGVEEVIAIEPSEPMWHRGERRAREAGLRVTRHAAFAENLPLPAESVDTAVSTFVLCSVRDPSRALDEVARVLRPGGRFLLLEHVENPGRFTARAQKLVTPLWSACLAGCHPGRDLKGLLGARGWSAEEELTIDLPRLPRLVRYVLRGAYSPPR